MEELWVDLVASLRSFVRVAETGSFSAVAAERGVTQPAISRQVSALEEHLGVRLVQRSTQAVRLTDEGRDLLSSATELLDSADALLQSASHRAHAPVGLVRMAVDASLSGYLGRHLPLLLDRHDGLSVELVVRDRCGALIEEGLDLEVHLGEAQGASTITRRVGFANAYVVAAPGYLAGRSAVCHPSDLEGLECLVQSRSGAADVWWFREGDASREDEDFDLPVPVGGRFASNNASTVLAAVLAGQGVASLSNYLVAEEVWSGRLVHLLPGYRCRGWPLFVSYPDRRRLPPRTRAVIDFLADLLRGDPVVPLEIVDVGCDPESRPRPRLGGRA